MSRPAILFPLFAELTTLAGVGPKITELFERIAIYRPRDLLFLLPTGIIDRRLVSTINGLPMPRVSTVSVEVVRHFDPNARGRPYRVLVKDAETEFHLIFFHARGAHLSKILPVGERRVVSGKVEIFDGIAQMPHPDHVLDEADAESLPDFEPVYPLTAGLAAKTMQKAISSALERLPEVEEWIAPSQISAAGWPDWTTAVNAAHSPQGAADIATTSPQRQRLAYDEFLAHQLTLAIARSENRREKGFSSNSTGKLSRPVHENLPFSPTGAQDRATAEILTDLAAPLRMNRLLQGDVGSGKTLVALMAALAVVEAGGQVALMAPTEILARQHFAAISSMLEGIDVSLEVLTGRDDGNVRQDKLERLRNGGINILIGTHSLFQRSVEFKDLRFAIIDEQHRFGVRERMELGQKGNKVDILVMTATPIPRSLELTHYGDMDVSILDEKPAGRLPIETVLISDQRLDDVVERLKIAVQEGRQIYWVCPLVEESEVMEATAAEERLKSLGRDLGENIVGLVHGQMHSSSKDKAMADFVSGQTRVLVATTVIEVGVDVPNASIMVIEGAENFGLAQLHQLRGRVGRGMVQSTCLLMYSGNLTPTARDRLTIMRETNDGFRIAEEDLRIRGAGDVLGVAQSGLPRFRVADPESQSALMSKARSDARSLLEMDPTLTSPRGEAARVLLYLMDQDQAFRMLSVG